MQTFFKRIRIFKIFWMFVLSLRLIMDENAIDVDDDSLEILLRIF